jgi:cytochrome P450
MLSGIGSLARLGPLSPRAAADRGHRAFARALTEAVPRRGENLAAEESVPELLSADEVFALLLAAHETIATGLAWMIELLAWAPRAANAVAGELDGSQQQSLDAAIWESLRLRPPLVDIVRQANVPVRLAGRNVQVGTLLLIPPPLIHMDAATEEDQRFEIARFRGTQPDPHRWLPFGGGERRCLGASLAMLELREILPKVIERFELAPKGSGPERVRLYGTALVPAQGARVVLRLRRK